MKLKEYFVEKFGITIEEFVSMVNAAPSVALAGGSGSGKSTTVLELLCLIMNRLLGNNIKSVQSSKIRNQIVPIKTKNNETVMVIHFDDPNLDLFMENAMNIIADKITDSRGEIEENDIYDIIQKLMFPVATKAYDIRKVFEKMKNNEELTERMKKAIQSCYLQIIGEEDSENYINDVIDAQKKAAKKDGKNFLIRDGYKKEIAKRNNAVNWAEVRNVFKDIAEGIKLSILEDINNMKLSGVMVDVFKDDYYILIDEKHIIEIDAFMKDIYSASGKDTVISYISYYTPMPEDVQQVFGIKNVLKENVPLFSIHDLKGLEMGEVSIPQTIAAISRSMPDALLVFQRTKDIVSWYDNFINTVKTQFPKLPIYGVFSFADMTLLDYLRGDFKSIHGPGTAVDEKSDYYRPAVLRSYEKLMEDVEPYVKKLNGINGASCLVCSNIPDFVAKVDEVLESEGKNKLYDEKRLFNLIAKICSEVKGKYKSIKTVDITNTLDDIHIGIDATKLKVLANQCVQKHYKRFQAEYFSYRNLNVHWNTVYKWRAMNKLGYGWSSDAKVYDNIKIYIGSMATGFIPKADLIDVLTVNFSDKAQQDEQDRIKEYLIYNFNMDIDKIKAEIAKVISYEYMKQAFDSTFFASALDLIKKNLDCEDYWYGSIEVVLTQFIDIEMRKTFE